MVIRMSNREILSAIRVHLTLAETSKTIDELDLQLELADGLLHGLIIGCHTVKRSNLPAIPVPSKDI